MTTDDLYAAAKTFVAVFKSQHTFYDSKIIAFNALEEAVNKHEQTTEKRK